MLLQKLAIHNGQLPTYNDFAPKCFLLCVTCEKTWIPFRSLAASPQQGLSVGPPKRAARNTKRSCLTLASPSRCYYAEAIVLRAVTLIMIIISTIITSTITTTLTTANNSISISFSISNGRMGYNGCLGWERVTAMVMFFSFMVTSQWEQFPL